MASERNAELKARYPRIDDPIEAINFALDKPSRCFDFLETWRDGAWSEIEEAYPEFLERVKPRCPFSPGSPPHGLKPNEPCPVCGDLGVDISTPSRCIDP
jgi:hypothetical protein